ncbi:MAG: oxidoreductase [Calditrichia bacterium]
MEKAVNVGLVGFGLSGRVFHAPFINANAGLNLCKVVERHSAKSREIYPQVEVVKDISELLEDEKIDLVVVTTPNRLHYEMAEQALKTGKHVVLEKPFTLTSREGKDLIELARREKRILTVYQNRRWDGDYLTVRKIIKNKWVGDPVEYEAHFDRFKDHVKPDAWKESAEPGAGILYDLGPHLIDQALQLFGRPKTVTADIRIQRSASKADDYFEIVLEYGYLKATLKAGMLVRENGPHFILHGTRGSFIKYGMDPQEAALRKDIPVQNENWGAESEEMWGILNTRIDGLHLRGKIETLPGSYQSFYQNLAEAIAEGEEAAVKPEEALDVIRVIELARQSSTEQRAVLFK